MQVPSTPRGLRLVDYSRAGVLSVRWMWLPTFIGQNQLVLRELQIAGQAKFGGKEVNDDVIDEIHEWVVEWLCKRFPVSGLGAYLRAISNVREN